MSTINEKIANVVLTTDHSASSYGIPVALINGKAYGPADRLEDNRTVAQMLEEEFGKENLSGRQLMALHKFLGSDPSGS